LAVGWGRPMIAGGLILMGWIAAGVVIARLFGAAAAR